MSPTSRNSAISRGRHDADEHRFQALGRERRAVLAAQLAVVPQQRRLVRAEVEIGRAGVHQQAEQLVHDRARLGQLGAAPPAGDDGPAGRRRGGRVGADLDQRARRRPA